MTGLHADGATKEPRRSKRLERSWPEAPAKAPPARRTRHAKGRVPPRKRETPAARIVRSPPPSRRAEAPVRPPMQEGSVPASRVRRSPSSPCSNPLLKREASAGTAYVLRNRHVPGTSNREPYLPARQEKRKKLEQHEPWEAPSCARVGLEHYNSMNQGDEHELVKAVGVHPFILCGVWLHANFLARPKGASNCFDLVPKCFFAELKLDGFGLHCASSVMIDSVESDNLGACGMCPSKIMHPADGVYRGGQTHRQPVAAGGYHGGQTRFEPDDDGDLDEAFSF